MNRRNILNHSFAAAVLSAVRPAIAAGRKPRILLRSSWQTINIGDIAHSPGVLAILEKHIPEAEVILWASHVGNGVREMILRRFPNLRIITAGGTRTTRHLEAEVHEMFDGIDLFLHGSGPWLVAARHVGQWIEKTGKPFGVYGITLPESRADAQIVSLLNQAKFVFFRDSVSLEVARQKGVAGPLMEFGPDGAFAFDIRDDEKACAFLEANQLEPGKFLCFIPRYRKTPEWELPGRERPEEDWRHHHEHNQALAEQDLRPYRETINAVVRNTKMKVLVCPEDQTQIALGKKFIYGMLPGDVKKRVVCRDHFWLTDEALSTFLKSAGLFGLEQHSPIMCIGNGVPAMLGRFHEQTSKGFMWKDIGLGGWFFDSDSQFDMEHLTPAVLELAREPEKAKMKALEAKAYVDRRIAQTLGVLRRELETNR